MIHDLLHQWKNSYNPDNFRLSFCPLHDSVAILFLVSKYINDVYSAFKSKNVASNFHSNNVMNYKRSRHAHINTTLSMFIGILGSLFGILWRGVMHGIIPRNVTQGNEKVWPSQDVGFCLF